MPDAPLLLRILSLVEATTINAVARNVLEFHRSANELSHKSAQFPAIEGSVVTFERGESDSPNEFVTAARDLGLAVEIIPERRRFDLGVLPKLKKVINEHSPDIVVTHSVKSHFLLWRSHSSRKCPWVAFHHGYTSTDRKMRVYNRLDRWSLPATDRIITVCQAFARDLSRNTGVALDDISVLHNSIRPQLPATDTEAQAVRSRFGIADDESLILAVGRLSKEKAHIDLIAAFSGLRKSTPEVNAKLMIVGEGPERGRLEAAANSFGCKESVVFAGQVSNVWPFYFAADVFVLPSHSEGSPNVLLEAMAAGIPIVATDVGGVPEMVEHNQSALLVPASDRPTLGAAIARVLTEDDLAQRLTENASSLVGTRYSPENYVRTLVEIYREVVRNRQDK
ncbi:MAG TPA: glycosyltransferase [Pyrinomonadaceae bacterium]|nr:glycosyltransferase [Pyrinomonadaceae bacterium]